VNSLNTIFSPNRKSLVPSTRNQHPQSFNSTSVSSVSFHLSPQITLKPYEKSLLKQSTPLIKQSSFDSILTTAATTKSSDLHLNEFNHTLFRIINIFNSHFSSKQIPKTRANLETCISSWCKNKVFKTEVHKSNPATFIH